MKKTFFPEEFLKKYKILLKDEWEEFLETISQKEPKSIWINTNKIRVNELEQKMLEKNIILKKYSFLTRLSK